MSKSYLNYSLTKLEEELESYPFDIDLNTIIPWCEIKDDDDEGPQNTYSASKSKAVCLTQICVSQP